MNYYMKKSALLFPKSTREKAACSEEVANHSQSILTLIQKNHFWIVLTFMTSLYIHIGLSLVRIVKLATI